MHGIDQVHGKFIKGLPVGKGSVEYFDNTIMEVNFNKLGQIHGKVRIFTTKGHTAQNPTLLAVGLYNQGQPHGPFWVYSKEQFIQIHFENGQLRGENTILVDWEAEWAMMGTLVNNSKLEDAHKIDLDWVGEYNCLQVMRIPKIEVDERTKKGQTYVLNTNYARIELDTMRLF